MTKKSHPTALLHQARQAAGQAALPLDQMTAVNQQVNEIANAKIKKITIACSDFFYFLLFFSSCETG